MLINHLKIFIRLFLKQTAFTLINILGLGVGLACCLIIALYVRHELSYDRFYTNADNLYRVNTVTTLANGQQRPLANTWFPVAPLLEANFPVITGIARWDPHISSLSVGENLFVENEFKMVDPAFFNLFDVVWLEGNPASAFSGATDLVVSRSFAQKYFGEEEALGQSVQMAQGPLLRVSGVIEDFPANTHLAGGAFASMALREVLGMNPQQWSDTGYYTYLSLQPDVDIALFQQQLDALAQATIPQPANGRETLRLQPITDIHMHYTLGDWPGKPRGDERVILVFSAIGIGILLVACANFINLSTARSSQRFNEVGMRLTLGARRSQLLLQFLGESVLFVLLALVFALTLVELTLPGIKALLGLNLAFDTLRHPPILALLLGAGLLLGLLAGWYPALVMSGCRPVTALKDPSRSALRGLALKNALVVLQFALAIGMVVAASVMYLQMRYVDNLDHGYVSKSVVELVTDDRAGSYGKRELLKERMLQADRVVAASLSSTSPAQSGAPKEVRTEGSQTRHTLRYGPVDFDFFALYEIALLEGRLPDADRSSDLVKPAADGAESVRGSLVINESAARELGWSAAEAPGKLLNFDGAWYEVIGVVTDTITTAASAARAHIYGVPEATDALYMLSVKLDESDLVAGMASIERTWKEVNPDEPIFSIVISDLIDRSYANTRKLEKLVFLFAGMAVFISCMGLFGLANLSTQHRTKEIGVRKVMGGSVWSIVVLLTNDFSKLVLISNLFAWPVAWLVMNQWLANFAFRIDLTPLVFIGSGLIALCIAWVTVGSTAAKAASRKPVLALRYE